jgi:Cu2+-exporting ATPase
MNTNTARSTTAVPDPVEPTTHENHDEDGGHGDHAHHSPSMFRDRFWLTLLLAIPVIVFSPTIQGWFGYSTPTFPGAGWVAPVLGTVIFFYGGAPFLRGGASEAKRRQPGMMLLIAMAISVAYGASLATTLGVFDLEFWWELAALIVVMLLGHWIEMRSIGRARGALEALADLLPDEAERVSRDGTQIVPASELQIDDVVVVRPGSRVPADGTIVDGTAEMDESMITGESKPVSKSEDDHVVAGTVATDSAIEVRVEAMGDDTALAGIKRLVAEAQSSHSKAQALADRAAAMLFYVAVASAIVTAIVWLALGQPDDALVRTVAVLVVACPHALGLAIPLVISISTSVAADNGILVKDRLALERMRTVDIVLFDKTGTLTKGEHTVTDVYAVDGDSESVLRLAAAAEARSEHPLGRAIVHSARERTDVPDAADFEAMSGRGVAATVEGKRIAVGGPTLARERNWNLDSLEEFTEEWSRRGAAILYVASDGEVAGGVALEDSVREASRAAVDSLHEAGIHVAMITGDAQQVADAVAADLGIDEVLAEVLPEEKHTRVADLQSDGDRVAMVGDGVNDAPALAQADVGIAIGAGTDVAIESAGIVLASDDPRSVIGVRTLSEASYRKMIQNLVWAAGYNVLAIPAAAGALLWAGFVLPPAAAAILMSASTVIVAANAQLLRKVALRSDS